MGEHLATSALTGTVGVPLGSWTSTIRRARISRERKLVALMVSSYANTDGTSVRCGVARLATDCQIGYSTARRHLAWLRQVGLVQLVKAGNRRAGRADEYRLTISAHTEEHVHVPTLDEYSALIEGVNDANRAAQKGRRLTHQRSPEPSAEPTDPVEFSALTMTSAEPVYQRSPATPLALTQVSPHLSVITSHPKSDLPTGGAPPPDPRRPQVPPTSALGTVERNSLSEPDQPPQDVGGDSRPRARADQPATSELRLIAEPAPSSALTPTPDGIWPTALPDRGSEATTAVTEAMARIAAARHKHRARETA